MAALVPEWSDASPGIVQGQRAPSLRPRPGEQASLDDLKELITTQFATLTQQLSDVQRDVADLKRNKHSTAPSVSLPPASSAALAWSSTCFW